MQRILDAIASSRCTVALTGAGVSTLCGIPDFRGPGGLYSQPDAERIFDIDWFDRDPSIYYSACRSIVYDTALVEPGPVHKALKLLEDRGLLAGIATQNIDMLHQKAGSTNVWEVHGSPRLHHCRLCSREATLREILALLKGRPDDYVPRCPVCGGAFKPDITFFGESLPERALGEATSLALRADVMLVLGTFVNVEIGYCCRRASRPACSTSASSCSNSRLLFSFFIFQYHLFQRTIGTRKEGVDIAGTDV